ncbi:MAG: hypothetical protein COU32_02145 [Candidatus Magasanikbacteria bacterium CG10_big_fil_rev_8_21_14_0_10_42_10]|uniref:Uncharacterized protein n=1 Tax=Candidatus Magasanikbacteria bacterium CG10_big_fil_rev_8_21_14_0_10_42_10 TaxID=1974649 RepID=A0A2H0TW87_9BACT|nr:MAG: hypothetical protein COU32_02145 [Candidatus Magasanikbacteria bacterium CG10_big_fil_rev_8_21_14_0_10_42_10]
MSDKSRRDLKVLFEGFERATLSVPGYESIDLAPEYAAIVLRFHPGLSVTLAEDLNELADFFRKRTSQESHYLEVRLQDKWKLMCMQIANLLREKKVTNYRYRRSSGFEDMIAWAEQAAVEYTA